MEGLYEISLGVFWTDTLTDVEEEFRSITIAPPPPESVEGEIYCLHEDEDLQPLAASVDITGTRLLRIVYQEADNEQLLDIAADIAGLLRQRTRQNVDVNPMIATLDY